MTERIGGVTPCDTWGHARRYRAGARVPDGSAPRNTEPQHAPAAAAAMTSANRRLMRGTLLHPRPQTTNDSPRGGHQA